MEMAKETGTENIKNMFDKTVNSPDTAAIIDDEFDNDECEMKEAESGLDGNEVLSLPFAPLQRLCKEILNEIQNKENAGEPSDEDDFGDDADDQDKDDQTESEEKMKTIVERDATKDSSGVRMSKEAIINSGKCSSLFVLYILDWAQEVAKKHKRTTVMPSDVITALMQSQIFDEQTVDYLSKMYLTSKTETGKKKAKAKSK